MYRAFQRREAGSALKGSDPISNSRPLRVEDVREISVYSASHNSSERGTARANTTANFREIFPQNMFRVAALALPRIGPSRRSLVAGESERDRSDALDRSLDRAPAPALSLAPYLSAAILYAAWLLECAENVGFNGEMSFQYRPFGRSAAPA